MTDWRNPGRDPAAVAGMAAMVGADTADNDQSTSLVAANADGSLVERLEAIKDQIGLLYGGTPATYVPGLGYRVQKAGNLATGAGTVPLFTVTGSVYLSLLVGEVTTVVATTTTLKIRDTTNSVDLCAATTITSDGDGTMYLFTGIASEVLNGTITPVVGTAYGKTGDNAPVVLGNAGVAQDIAAVLDQAGTGVVTWTLFYLPLTSTAAVVAA